jgi:ribosomal protein L28
MARECEICGKSSQKGKKIKLIWGLKYRSIRHRQPNLRKTTVLVDGEPVRTRVCTNCLKNIKAGKYTGVKPLYQKEETQPEESAGS